MTARKCEADLPLPRRWRKVTRTGVLHAISVAAMAMTSVWSKASAGRSSRQRALAEVDRLRTEVALLTEELELKDARWARVPARRRPYYRPRGVRIFDRPETPRVTATPSGPKNGGKVPGLTRWGNSPSVANSAGTTQVGSSSRCAMNYGRWSALGKMDGIASPEQP